MKAELHRVEHHRAHIASSFYVSGFEEAACLSVDGFGDFVSTMFAEGTGTKLDIFEHVEFPHSLGVFYTAATQYIGFHKYGDEYKVMGLASYGEPEYLSEFRKIVQLKNDGQFELDLDYFLHHSEGVDMTWYNCAPTMGMLYSDKFAERFGPPREPRAEITKRHENIAASLQAMLEEAVFHLLDYLYQKTKNKNLCMAGGVAFNCVANGKILENTPFQEIFIQPAAGDAGTAIGAAYYIYHSTLGEPRCFTMKDVFYGPGYSDKELAEALEKYELKYEVYDDEGIVRAAAKAAADGQVVGWFQGRSEFGPRALGNRSIVVDPRSMEMKDLINKRVKYREPFRPFCPSILAEAVGDYFEQTYPEPFMLKAYKVKEDKKEVIPAVTHVDGTGRLQSVQKDVNPKYWTLIKEFENLTGVPVVLNTSFNENEPIVNSPEEAIECFLRTKMDCLILGNYFVRKEEHDVIMERVLRTMKPRME